MPVASTVAVLLPAVASENVTDPGPDTLLHAPVPTVGVLPPREVEIRAPQIFCVLPTVAVVGVA